MPLLLAAGVPASVAVPLPLSTNVTPAGRAPLSDNIAVGIETVVIVNDPVVPGRSVPEEELANRGANGVVLRKTPTVSPTLYATAMSGAPSPLKSATATALG